MGTCEGRTCMYCGGTGTLSENIVCEYCCGSGFFGISSLEKSIINDSCSQKTKDDFINSIIACSGNQTVANELKRYVESKEFSELA